MITIGVDFDNTIVCYDEIFHRAALEKKLIPESLPKNKESVKKYLRNNGKENIWTELQGYVYGTRMLEAAPYPAFIEFLQLTKEKSYMIYIVSHKTQYPYLGPQYDLHQAAREWIERNKLFDAGYIDPAHVFFELTAATKLARIKEINCQYFIDDLTEILLHENFPANVNKFLFQPNSYLNIKEDKYKMFKSWNHISQYFLDLKK